MKHLGLDAFDEVIGLGGKEYRAALTEAFDATTVDMKFPFAGLPIGKMLRATRQVLDAGSQH